MGAGLDRGPLRIPIFDGHNDVLQRVAGAEEPAFDFFAEHAEGHLDLPRALRGGQAGGFFAIFVPNPDSEDDADPNELAPDYEVPLAARLEPEYASAATWRMLEALWQLEARSDGIFRVILEHRQLERSITEGTFAAIAHLEGADGIDQGLERLGQLYANGLRSLGITWSRPNAFGHGVPFRFPSSPDTGPGLTPAGRELVRSCNELGILIDLSHLTEAGFWDVARLSTKPLVASHSNAHALCPTSRNLTDRQLDAVAESGGLVGINFAVQFLRSDGAKDPDTPVAEIARHAAYIAGRLGPEHVALGSDFDGAKISAELQDAAGLPRVVDALRAAGFADRDLALIAHENWLRVLGATWRTGPTERDAH